MMKNNFLSLTEIKSLPKELADKIAAGEVVERPLSIVKELLENSIDAGADNITVEIKKGGKEYIRVTDNGKGIEKDQLEIAFKRYATSKISKEEDLEKIMSLGFRGEALASIAAVSRVDLVSKTAESKTGGRIVFDAGELISKEDTACEEGTSIIVRDLFYNLPARLKFMKPDNAESSLVADYVQKMALAYPEVKFRFINNGTILFSTLGKGSLYDAILTLYSPQTAKALVNVEYKAGAMHLYGYTSGAELSKSNKRSQVFFVNGRWIKSKILDSALEEAYHDKLFEGRHPVCYLFLELDPSEIDVNVHPSKTEIKFYDESLVKDFVILGIRKALLTQSAAPDIADMKKSNSKSTHMSESCSDSAHMSERCDEFQSAGAYNIVPLYEKKTENKVVDSNLFLSIKSEDEFFSQLREEQQSIEIPTIRVSEDIKKELAKPRRFYFSSLKAVAQIFTTYIIATDEQSMYIVDQHAAHERIMYERLLAGFNGDEKASQILLAPILMHITAAQAAMFDVYWGLLSAIGFSAELFGPKEIIIKEIPASLKLEEAELFVNSVLESDADNLESFQEKRDSIISASCKAAVKAGDKLSAEEIQRLFEDLDKCENPFSCPHGRPTFLRFSESEIEHFFKRK